MSGVTQRQHEAALILAERDPPQIRRRNGGHRVRELVEHGLGRAVGADPLENQRVTHELAVVEGTAVGRESDAGRDLAGDVGVDQWLGGDAGDSPFAR